VENKVELECAYFGCVKEIITPPAAISIRGFYDYLTKYGDIDIKTQTVFPNEEIRDKLKHYTGALSGLLAVKDISRFDYFLTESGEIYFNEVNTFPGFTERSLYLDMLAASGIGDDEFLRAAIREVPL
jgi:D-alanine-D-alanine ligase